MLEDSRGRIEYEEEGTGPTIVFVPGSWGTRSAWRGVIAAVGGSFRSVTTSLLGYGSTVERRTAADAAVEQEAEMLEAVVRHAGDGVHLVGHSYGGVACLAVAMRNKVPLVSLTVIEPVAFDVLRQAGDGVLHEQFMTVRDVYFRAFEAGDKEAARGVIDFFTGVGSFDALPARMREYVIASTPAHFLDMRAPIVAPLSAYAGVSLTSLILRGERTHPALGRTAEILGGAMPKASLVTVPGANHFMIATHADAVAGQLVDHISRTE